MNQRVYRLVNTYLSEVLFSDLKKLESKFVGSDVMCWKSGDDIVIMIEGSDVKLTGKIWYELTHHFSLSVSDVNIVIVRWIKKNLGVNKKLKMGECSYTRVMFGD